ncbi:hypothetical protein A3K48_06695 [candidate division WOR-1 bacterium RIFOXYA12_FULL_52_29]|uniref:PAS domain-containing protein n=1 Tax=candidate division WOR-1 bacterium RIFOXYC12_FULL_54_18 TaxID=1802584 RepID=A0A1F4T7K9_UNCSA|nr:MAG: hypothetical protein A3K44_06695 [candidate division WOR-1 bacterium RIFOXYA2_FULL_51_19]OGC18209.1 MAG: hypothetical protein A3K48_06695 [candidate division WOR-1 bacterium RIFOXYA12_FULL_52_29]OGC27064.1 MAG: hypothetical protein A3K32_06690 [candidate division WOR-1 bacterium RIFOXYB2_FULL_45_9]OGC28626.1 MAG: hypothetical protein A3K49_06695 [candidate division WOR-1 bacterium RIFOXYC12_FULL_54_18]OGC30919.1 MAG: hypothetical protein A2346_05925 [candidate division WOR-1 bacterium R
MTSFPFIYGYSILACGGVSLLIGIFLFSRYHSGLGRNYFFLTTSIFCVAITEAFLRLAPNPEAAQILGSLTVSCWYLAFLVYIYFAVSFTECRFKFWPVIIPLTAAFLWLYTSTNVVIAGYQKYPYGYGLVPGEGYILNSIMTDGLLIIGLYYLFKARKEAREYYRRMQAGVFILATIVPAVVGEIIDHWLIFAGQYYVPLGVVSVTAIVIIAAYGILRYAPIFGLSNGAIAEAAALVLGDPLFIVDSEKVINYANPGATKLTGWPVGELIGKRIELYLSAEKGKIYNLKRNNRNNALVNLEIFPVAGDKGYIYLARDLSSMVALRKAVRKMTAANNLALRRERKTIEIIFEFADALKLPDIEAIWWRVEENEDQLTRENVRPVYLLTREFANLVKEVGLARDAIAAKVSELEKANMLMVGREEALRGLEKRYEALRKK